MIRGSTSHAPRRFLSPSPYRFEPVIDIEAIDRLIKAARKRMRKSSGKERNALRFIIEEMQDLKEKL